MRFLFFKTNLPYKPVKEENVRAKQFDTACEQFRSLAGEISCARQQLQANITRLNDLERRWEHFVEHGFPQDTPNLESSGPLAIDRSQNSSSFAEGFPGGTSSAFSYEFDSVPVPSSPNYSPIRASARDDGSLEGTLAEPGALPNEGDM